MIPLLLCACGPETGPADVAVLRYDRASGSYGIGVEHLATLHSATELRGDAATAVGGAKIRFDTNTSTATILERGSPVHAQYVEKDGALWPVDFDSLNMATAYWSLEQSRAYAQARGMGNQLDGVKFLYYPSLTVVGRKGALADNAAWVSGLDEFVLPPFAMLQEIPLPMNEGVLSHEYGHAIFGKLVYGDPSYDSRWCNADESGAYLCTLGVFMVGLVEEGFADAWALGVTGDPQFIDRSIPGQTGRDVTPFDPTRHCTNQLALRDEVRRCSATTDPGSCWGSTQYLFGTVWASALWQAGQAPGTTYDQVMTTVFRSYGTTLHDLMRDDTDGTEFGQFQYVGSALVNAAVDDATRSGLCASLQDRFAMAIPECTQPASSECP